MLDAKILNEVVRTDKSKKQSVVKWVKLFG